MNRSRLGKPLELSEVVNQYTVGHLAVGVILGLTRVPWWGALATTATWEVGERGLKSTFPDAFPNPEQDSWANSVMDSVAVMAGWALMQLFRHPFKHP